MSDRFSLDLAACEAHGHLRRIADPHEQIPFLSVAGGHELELNGVPLQTQVGSTLQAANEHITLLTARLSTAYGAGATLQIRRVLTRGGRGGHNGPPQSLHLRYEIRRVPHTAPGDGLDYIWQPEIEAPLRVNTLSVLCGANRWFGPETRMRALAIGGSGPREHVSLEDGPVADVTAYLRTGFRSAFPGQPSVNGALFYHPKEQHFVWMLVRRPSTGGRMHFTPERQSYEFGYFRDLAVNEELTTPAVSFLWGRGLANADRVLAEQFDRYEEPPPWWYKTVWFWLHPIWQTGGSFETMRRGAEVLMEEAGVNGFGLAVHDVPWSGNDIDVGSPRPSPSLGGTYQLRKAVEAIRNKGGHTYAWISRHGHRPDQLGYRESWAIRGIDGRPIRIRNQPDSGVFLDILNPADPTFQEYIFGWIEHYVKVLGITGIFWDSGLQPLPPDFGNKPYLKHPGEAMAWPLEFYERVYQFGKSLSDDFFMWVEGISTDVPMNAFAVDNHKHGNGSGHELLRRISHVGPKRLVWRSAWQHDVGSGFPFVSPVSDINWNPEVASYRKVAEDPMNRWLCRTVKERGIRHAIGLSDGISLLDEFVVACPGVKGSVVIPSACCRGEVLEHVLHGQSVRGKPAGAGMQFDLPDSGAYRMR